ncbi:MAG: PQQ-binding-like beta-propeller repeat protein [bacterium]
MKRAALALAVVVAAIVLVAPDSRAGGPEWPGWRGPKRDGLARETGLASTWPAGGPPLLWKAEGMGAGFASIAVSGGRIYTMGDRDREQYLLAFDAERGAPLWSYRVGPALPGDNGGSRGTPTVDGDTVFALGTEGDLVAVDAVSGHERWRRSLPRDFGGKMMSAWSFSESPLVDGDRVLVTPGSTRAAIVALDKATGKDVWRTVIPDLGPAGADGAGYSSIVVSEAAGTRQYVQLLGRGLVGVRASDGRFLWGYNRVANSTANISTPLVRGNWVFASTGYDTGSALVELARASEERVDAREVYFLAPKTFQNHHGGMVLVGNHVYGGHGHGRGSPICIELTTGKVAWGGDIRNAGTGSAAVTYADGNLYFRYQNGVVLLIEATPDGYREKGSLTIPDVRRPSWSLPVVAGGRLFLREQETLYVYDLRKRA